MFDGILNIINPVVLVLVLMGGLFAKNYLKFWQIDTALKTLIVGSVFVGVMVFIKWIDGTFKVTDLESYFITYCITTSLYELLLRHFMDWIKKNQPKSLNAAKTEDIYLQNGRQPVRDDKKSVTNK